LPFLGLRLEQASKRLGAQLILLGLCDYADAKWLYRRYLERSETSQHRDDNLRAPKRCSTDCCQSMESTSRSDLQGRHGSYSGLPNALCSHPPLQVGTAL